MQWYFVAALLTILTSSQGILTTLSQSNGKYLYDYATVPFLAEVFKLVVSSILLWRECQASPSTHMTTDWKTVRLYPIPSVIYLIHNNVQFATLVYVDTSTYQIMGNLKIVTTGILFRARPGMARRTEDREKEKAEGSREKFTRELEEVREELKKIPRLEQGMELLLARMEELMDRQSRERRNFQTAGVEVRGGQATPGEKSSERVRLPCEAGMRMDCRTRRVEMPSFDGENPDGWIFRAERYFATKGLSENEKLEEAVVSLDGEARAWFQWEDGRRVIRSWPELKVMVLERFRPTHGGSLEDLPSSHSKRMVEDGSGGGSGTGWNRINHIQPFRSPSTGLLEVATPNDKSYGLSPNDESFLPRSRSMPSVRHFSEIPVGRGSIRAIATRDCNTERPDSGRIWTGSGDSSELEWDPNHIRTGLHDFRVRDEGRQVGLGEIALDSEDSRRKGLVHGGRWSERKRRSRAATFGAGLTISDAAETGLDKWIAVWTGTHDSSNVEAVSGRYSSNPLNSGDIMLRAWKFGFKPGVGGAEFRNSGQLRAGSRISGVGKTDSAVGFGLRNSNVIGPTSGSIGVGPKRKFNKSGSNFSKLCNWSSIFGPNWTESGNSSSPGVRAGEIDFIGVGLGHSANGRCDNSEFVTPKTKISMFHGLNNGSSRNAMPFNILKSGLDDIGRRWRHSTAVT